MHIAIVSYCEPVLNDLSPRVNPEDKGVNISMSSLGTMVYLIYTSCAYKHGVSLASKNEEISQVVAP